MALSGSQGIFFHVMKMEGPGARTQRFAQKAFNWANYITVPLHDLPNLTGKMNVG